MMSGDTAHDESPESVHIGEVADRTGLSLRTIRHYDEIGLVRASGRTDGGFRLYTPDDVRRLLTVRLLKPLGFSLDEMSTVLGALDSSVSDDHAARIIARTIETIELRTTELQHQLARLDDLVDALRDREEAIGTVE